MQVKLLWWFVDIINNNTHPHTETSSRHCNWNHPWREKRRAGGKWGRRKQRMRTQPSPVSPVQALIGLRDNNPNLSRLCDNRPSRSPSPGLSDSPSYPTRRMTPAGDTGSSSPPGVPQGSPQSPAPEAPTGSSLTCSRSWRWVPRGAGSWPQRCAGVGSSWRRRRTGSCCRSPEGLLDVWAGGWPPPASPCHCDAPWSCCYSGRTPRRRSSYHSTRS